MNANAGRINPRLARALRAAVPADRLHLTETPEHAQEVLTRCVEDEVGTVFAGGGDGTIVGVINGLARHSGEAPLPKVGVLRLGTGNALAHWLGSRSPLSDLRQWQGGRVHRAIPVSMVEVDGTWFPFGGLGHDAAILNDYNALKSQWMGRPAWRLLKGVPGYLAAGFLKTLPNWMGRPRPRVRIFNLGRAYRIGRDGQEVGDPSPAASS